MKPINALLLSAPLALSVASCTTVEYVPVNPQCTPPPQPALPELSKGELWESIGDEQYRVLERYINGLWAFSDEQGAMLKTICFYSP